MAMVMIAGACAQPMADTRARFPGFHDGNGITPAIVERTVTEYTLALADTGDGDAIPTKSYRYQPRLENSYNLTYHLYGPNHHYSWRDRYWYDYQRQHDFGLFSGYYDPFYDPWWYGDYDWYGYQRNMFAYNPWYYDPYSRYGGYYGYGNATYAGYYQGHYYGGYHWTYYAPSRYRSGSSVSETKSTQKRRRRNRNNGGGSLMGTLLGNNGPVAASQPSGTSSGSASKATTRRSRDRSTDGKTSVRRRSREDTGSASSRSSSRSRSSSDSGKKTSRRRTSKRDD